MPKTRRDKLKQKLAQSIHHLEAAKDDLGEVWAAFDGREDGYAASLELIASSIDSTRTMIRSFWAWVWGKVPDDTTGYRR